MLHRECDVPVAPHCGLVRQHHRSTCTICYCGRALFERKNVIFSFTCYEIYMVLNQEILVLSTGNVSYKMVSKPYKNIGSTVYEYTVKESYKKSSYDLIF